MTTATLVRADKAVVLQTLRAFLDRRPGMDWRNYGDGPAYRADYYQVRKDREHALALLRHVELSGITGDAIVDASRRAFAGRLEFSPDCTRIDYTTGQYFPTEYRKAVCAVLAAALWAYWRADQPDADGIRKAARRAFGSGIAARWFA